MLYKTYVSRLGSSTTTSWQIDALGQDIFGNFWGGVFARDTLPAIHPETRAYVVNTDHAPRPDGSGKGIHWIACLDMHGNRYLNDPLGHYGRKQRRELEKLQPYQFSEDDPEQMPHHGPCMMRPTIQNPHSSYDGVGRLSMMSRKCCSMCPRVTMM
eukprot:COSAG01_NODE_16208_length_1259_cov_64.797414_2_plen_156_part_00